MHADKKVYHCSLVLHDSMTIRFYFVPWAVIGAWRKGICLNFLLKGGRQQCLAHGRSNYKSAALSKALEERKKMFE